MAPQQQIKNKPFGTLEELAAFPEGPLSPRLYGSCSEPISGQNVGCKEWQTCTLHHRGKSGPRNGGVRLVKIHPATRGRVIVQTIMDCTCFAFMKPQIEGNGGVAEWVAEEGEEIKVRGSEPHDEIIPGEPGRRIYEDKLQTKVVKAFPRPAENKELVDEQFASEIIADAKKARDKERSDNALRPAKK